VKKRNTKKKKGNAGWISARGHIRTHLPGVAVTASACITQSEMCHRTDEWGERARVLVPQAASFRPFL